MESRQRGGATLVELLTVIAIIALIITLSLPAVQAAREKARRTQCTNNLRQLGVAMQSFESAKGGYPPCRMMNPPKSFGIKKRHSWAPFMFPYMELAALSDQYNFNVNFDDGTDTSTDTTNSLAIRADVPILLCPSAPTARKQQGMTLDMGVTDYSPTTAVTKSEYLTVELPPASKWLRGVLGQNIYRPVSYVLDGTSNTTAFAECAGRPQTWERGQRVAADHPPAAPGRRARLGGWAQPTNLINITGLNPDVVQPDKTNPNYPGPCAVNCDNGENLYSFHPGGANILMADGAVRFLRATVSLDTVAILLTPNDSLVVPVTAF